MPKADQHQENTVANAAPPWDSAASLCA